jgi:predicted negative regulator of RcsB-dependent stress response
MPTYKQRPISKKQKNANLPFYRPIDHLAFKAMENRRKLAPFLIAGVLAFTLFGGFKAYSVHYEEKASRLLNEGQDEVLAKEYRRSKAAKIARMKLGKRSLDAKEYDRAVDWYGPVASDASAPALLRVAAQQNLAFAYLKKGDAAKALEWLDKASKDPQNSSDDYTQLLIARVHEISGEVSGESVHKDKALMIYKTLSEGSREPAVQEEAQARKKWLSETKPTSLPSSR